MRLLLTGVTGQVGHELAPRLPRMGVSLAADRNRMDLADPDSIRRVVRDFKPDVIVNAAAYTAVDRAEQEVDLADRVNGIAPGVLAEESRRIGARLIHYSTDYVFDGRSRRPYEEDDPVAPLNAYGRTKLAGEQAIRAVGGRYLILRASWVYAPHGRNFFLTIARKVLAGQALRVVSDQYGVPTSAEFLAECTCALIDMPDREGLCHLVPSGSTTWHGFAQAIADRVKPGATVAAITSADYPVPARRPQYSVLSNRRAAQWLGERIPFWEALLDNCVERFRSGGSA